MEQSKGLIKYQWLLRELVARDLKIKYRRRIFMEHIKSSFNDDCTDSCIF